MTLSIETFNLNSDLGTEALIADVFNEVVVNDANQDTLQKKMWSSYLKRTRFFRDEKIKQMGTPLKKLNTQESLAQRLKLVSMTKALKGTEKWLKGTLTERKDLAETAARQKAMSLKLLNEVDEGREFLSNDEESIAAESFSQEGQAVVSEALKVTNGLIIDAKDQRRFQGNRKQDQLNQNLDKQSSATHGLLKALKKSKFMGMFVQVFTQLVGVGISALTAGAGSPLGMALSQSSKFFQTLVPALTQGLLGGMTQFSGQSMMQPVQKEMQDLQMQESNAVQSAQDLVMQASRDDAYLQHQTQSLKKVQGDLESGL